MDEFQEIKSIGFPALIEKIKEYKGHVRNDTVFGIGDDASVFKSGKKDDLFTTTSEIFLEGVHFDLTYSPFQHLGYKLVSATVSDLYAMNSNPMQLLVSIAIPNKVSVQMVEQFFNGVDTACKGYEVELTGGDTTASHQILAVSMSAIGKANKKEIVYRKGAQDGDLICVTGDLGSALAGLRILLREKQEWQQNDVDNHYFQPDLSAYEYVVKRQLMPVARRDLILALQESDDLPTSMIDLSQGLLADLKNLLHRSGVGAEIYSPAVPISPDTRKVADEMEEDVDKYAFYGGEDYEMLFTMSEEKAGAFRKTFDDFTVVGKIDAKSKKLLLNTGEGETAEFDI
ncbi:MAG: thiamine-phosphate kinase, partial [Balneolaceae bacterium]